ncbi:MAG TPA: type IV secretion system DotC family protein [Methylocella sp.]|nr:type IV secretion system DotC family protein [Methylocella sp.]
MSRKARLRIGVSVLVLAMHNGVQAADKHVAPASASGSATTQASGPDQLTVLPVPPMPPDAYVDRGAAALGNPLNKPVTGAAEQPAIEGGEKPPSLEALQATRPSGGQASTLEPGRADALYQAAITYGAQGGLAARAFAINDMLRRYEAALDNVYDFQPLVLRLGGGQTMLRPPIVTQAQMAFALGESGQVARETGCIYQITRDAQLASAPPNWRTYLVRHWSAPARPSDAVLPRTDEEVAYWNKWVAEGWGQGERQAVEIYLDDLGRLQRDIVGMARYHVLLRSGLVIHPKIVFSNSVVNGGGRELRAIDRIIRITDQKGLKVDSHNWRRSTASCPG